MNGAVELEALLAQVRARGASDLHLAPGAVPRARVDGELVAFAGPALGAGDVRALCAQVLDEAERLARDPRGDVSVAFETPAQGRFRVSLFQRAGALGAVFRAIPAELPALESLGLPAAALELCELPRGLVLVTGPSGSGRSTTLAAMVRALSAQRGRHVVTLEEPIEHVHPHARGLVSQREVGRDAPSLAAGARAALRQDPDVVVLGELADADAADAALAIAEAGHLCLAAARGTAVVQVLAGIVDAFAAHRQGAARARLARSLAGVLGQRLLPRDGGGARVLAVELLIPGASERALVRDDDLPALQAHVQAGGAGLQSLELSLADLYLARRITLEHALRQSGDATELQQLIAARGQPAPRRTTDAFPTTRRS
jgi:twitching motility protein PilT